MPDSAISADAGERRLSHALRLLVEHTPPARFDRVAAILRESKNPDAAFRAELRSENPSSNYEHLVDELCEAWRALPGVGGASLSIGFDVACESLAADRETLEIAWTGPATPIVTGRHTSAVLFELIAAAQTTLTLFSFATHNIAGLPAALRAALDRHVRVRLIIETPSESGGKYQGTASPLLESIGNAAEFYVWPGALRPSGAVMHAKCVLVDERVAFVTSANLTEYGIDRNLELGIVIRGGRVPRQLAVHVDRLIAAGELVRLKLAAPPK